MARNRTSKGKLLKRYSLVLNVLDDDQNNMHEYLEKKTNASAYLKSLVTLDMNKNSLQSHQPEIPITYETPPVAQNQEFTNQPTDRKNAPPPKQASILSSGIPIF